MVADVAMGEPAGLIQEAGENGQKKLEWYGFIRLIIYARSDHTDGKKLIQARNINKVKTCVIPCGDKATSIKKVNNNNTTNDMSNSTEKLTNSIMMDDDFSIDDDYDSPYLKSMSPDKGAVCAYFPTAKLMIVAAHLHGTNKPLPEAVFNVVREQQLRRIGHAVTWLVNQYHHDKDEDEKNFIKEKEEGKIRNIEKHNHIDNSSSHIKETNNNIINDASNIHAALLIIGDLNFRVESEYTSVEDKEKGGLDFKTIEKFASSENKKQLNVLLEKYDILYSLLRSPNDEIPPIIVNCRDCVAETICKQNTLLPPTFTFKQDSPFPRKYKNKRTPSWYVCIYVVKSRIFSFL